MEKDAQFVEMIVKELVENPDDVKVERSVDEMGVLVTLWVNPADMGKIIGKEGRTAKAIRTLLRVLGARQNARVTLKIAEPEGGSGGYEMPDDMSTGESAPAPIESSQPAPAAEEPAAMTDENPEPTDSAPDQEDESPTSIL